MPSDLAVSPDSRHRRISSATADRVPPAAWRRISTNPSTAGCAELATQFEGAYPYLRLLAGAHGCDDPLDPDVVEAYWIGNHLLDEVTTLDFGNSIDDRFRRRAGAAWHRIDESIPAGVAHHSYHVLHVMPWAGLLQRGVVDEPLRIIDQCCVTLGPGRRGRRRHTGQPATARLERAARCGSGRPRSSPVTSSDRSRGRRPGGSPLGCGVRASRPATTRVAAAHDARSAAHLRRRVTASAPTDSNS